MRIISIAALNVVLPPPHRPERYVKLWMDAARRKTPVGLRGDVGGMIGSANNRYEEHKFVWGDLFKFVNIDRDAKWLDLSTNEVAAPEDVTQNVRIPESYRPNLRVLPYIFFPDQHRLIFISRLDQQNTLSPGMAKTLVERLLNSSDLIEAHGEAVITVEPDRETLDRIFHLPVLKQISFEISPPNALGDVERRLFKWMEDQNATKFTQNMSSDHPDGLQLGRDQRQVAEVAQSNGLVTARGIDEAGQTVKYSTIDHPYLEKVEVDTGTTTIEDSFFQAALGMLRNFVRVGG
ncbi:DUF4747 family protein [Undibacterium sp.]|jgi:hypothetical protein|uniref:DUF4747 family protein n=1 Tax=Undibacterium sp. TaxID=1914977 RepID=UPI002C21BAD7|nr:DUF4747 family protein [Undibacterium sp.]HTD04021.1 DUF4747 family protein [Undibacterium sp.]